MSAKLMIGMTLIGATVGLFVARTRLGADAGVLIALLLMAVMVYFGGIDGPNRPY